MSFSTLRANTASETIYLDHNATTPVAAELLPKVQEWLSAWGNPSSIHWAGRKPKTLIRDARKHISQLLGCDPLEVVFTSGGSESNNHAIKGVFDYYHKPSDLRSEFRNHYLFSSVEHPSVTRTAEYLIEKGAEVEFIPVDRSGALDMDAYRKLLRPTTALVSVMFANNETGNIFPIQEMTKLAHEQGAFFHTDGVQALGKIAFSLRDLGVDMASFSGHKFYAYRGCGVLFVRRGLPLESLIHGGAQERHRRGGTENTLAICALGAMAQHASTIAERAEALRVLRDEFERQVLTEIDGASITGGESPRLPNTSSLIISGVDGETLLMNLDLRGFAVSTGAACSSGSPEPSPVLLSMGLSRQEAQNSLRVGLGWSTTDEQMKKFVTTLKDVVIHIRSIAKSVEGATHA